IPVNLELPRAHLAHHGEMSAPGVAIVLGKQPMTYRGERHALTLAECRPSYGHASSRRCSLTRLPTTNTASKRYPPRQSRASTHRRAALTIAARLAGVMFKSGR